MCLCNYTHTHIQIIDLPISGYRNKYVKRCIYMQNIGLYYILIHDIYLGIDIFSIYICAVLSCLVCPTLCDFIDCSPPCSSVHGETPGKNIGVGCHALLQRIFPNQGSNPGLPHWRQILYLLSHQGSPYISIYIQTQLQWLLQKLYIYIYRFRYILYHILIILAHIFLIKTDLFKFNI